MALKSSQRELQDCFKLHPNQRSEQEVMVAQSPGSANRDSFGSPLWEPREKVPFGCSLGGELQGEPLAGREATAPSIIRRVQITQRGRKCHPMVALSFSRMFMWSHSFLKSNSTLVWMSGSLIWWVGEI
jgi:hypothetical protein